MIENSSIYQITCSVQIIFADNSVNHSLLLFIFTHQSVNDTESEILSSIFLYEPEVACFLKCNVQVLLFSFSLFVKQSYK